MTYNRKDIYNTLQNIWSRKNELR